MPRLFYALWPDAAAREALGALAKRVAAESGGRPVPAANLHLTLAFLGDVPAERVGELARIGGRIASRPFRLAIDRTGRFRQAGVAWAGPSEVPPALAELQATLDQSLRAAGFAIEARPFAPHVTLARKVARAPQPGAVEPVAWPVAGFSLVESARERGAYRDIGRWESGREY